MKSLRQWPAALAALALFLQIPAVASEGDASFSHDVEGTARPWTDAPFDAEDGKFTFAVVSDLTGGERPRVFDIAIAQLN
ncbi:MAG: hypothetical protein PVJ17_13890, partial [Lysobacterales bacterium]